MVNEEMILDSVRKMKSSGLSSTIISSTLADFGLSPEEVRHYLLKVGFSLSGGEKKEEDFHEKLASRTAEKIKGHLIEHEVHRMNEQELRDLATHSMMDEHKDKLDLAQNKLNSVEDKMKHMEKSISNLEGKLDGQTDLLKKILDHLKKH